MNFESFEFDEISSYRELHAYLKERISNKSITHYLLIDEVQQVGLWEKVINSFMVDANVDIYLTGSNAYLLSSELSTLLSGRYVEIKMQPLSFKEYLTSSNGTNKTAPTVCGISLINTSSMADFPPSLNCWISGHHRPLS